MTGEPMGELLLYRRGDGTAALEVRLQDESLWLSQQQIAELFQTSQQNVSLHLKNIYDEGELVEEGTHKDILLVRQEGSRSIRRSVRHYNLDAIISVGYRVKSTQYDIYRSHLDEVLSDVETAYPETIKKAQRGIEGRK